MLKNKSKETIKKDYSVDFLLMLTETVFLLLCILLLWIIFPSTRVFASPASIRTASGTYYNYMCIETSDGNEWLLSDSKPKSNPYMRKVTVFKNGKRTKEYVPVFKSGQKVIVTFDTRGTKTKKDDRIISVKKKGGKTYTKRIHK